MVQTYGEAEVYLVMFCEKKWIPNPPTLDGIFNSWKIHRFKKEPGLEKSSAVTNGALLIKDAKSPKVYIHTNGHKYWICNPATFNKFNFDWKKIHTLPVDEVDKIPTGETLCS